MSAKYNKVFLVVALLVVVVVVFVTVFKPKPKTVDYYLSHVDEMRLVLKECSNNPGQLNDDPDCMNANEAQSKLIHQAGRDNMNSVRKAINSGF